MRLQSEEFGAEDFQYDDLDTATAAWKALDRPEHFECLLWVSNLCE